MNSEIQLELETLDKIWTAIQPLTIDAKERCLAWLSSSIAHERQNQWRKDDEKRMAGLNSVLPK